MIFLNRPKFAEREKLVPELSARARGRDKTRRKSSHSFSSFSASFVSARILFMGYPAQIVGRNSQEQFRGSSERDEEELRTIFSIFAIAHFPIARMKRAQRNCDPAHFPGLLVPFPKMFLRMKRFPRPLRTKSKNTKPFKPIQHSALSPE